MAHSSGGCLDCLLQEERLPKQQGGSFEGKERFLSATFEVSPNNAP